MRYPFFITLLTFYFLAFFAIVVFVPNILVLVGIRKLWKKRPQKWTFGIFFLWLTVWTIALLGSALVTFTFFVMITEPSATEELALLLWLFLLVLGEIISFLGLLLALILNKIMMRRTRVTVKLSQSYI